MYVGRKAQIRTNAYKFHSDFVQLFPHSLVMLAIHNVRHTECAQNKNYVSELNALKEYRTVVK